MAVGLLIGHYLLLLFVLNFSPTQQFLTDKAAALLSGRLGTELRIGRVEVGLFNRVTLIDVGLKDRSGRDMLRARSVSCKIELLPLLQSRVSLRSVSLLDADVRLYTPTRGAEPNFRFLLDAFRSKEPRRKSALNLRVNSLIMRRCRVTYDVLTAPHTPGRFNADHLAVAGLDANVSLKKLTPDSLNLRVRKLAFAEQSGIRVEQLRLRLEANRRQGRVADFVLQMPGSRIAQSDWASTYDARSVESFWRTLSTSGTLGRSYVSTDDVSPFLPELAGLHRKVYFSTAFKIAPSLVALSDVDVYTGRGDLALRADLRMKRTDGRPEALEATVEKLHVAGSLQQRCYELFVRRPMPAPLPAVGDVGFEGRLAYERAGRGSLAGQLDTELGSLMLDARLRGRELRARAASERLLLSPLIAKDGGQAWAAFRMKAVADLSKKKHPDVEVDLELPQFLIKGYTYRDVRLGGRWQGSRLAARLGAADPNLAMDVSAEARLDGKRLSALQAAGHVQRLAPAALGWGGKVDDAVLSARFAADVTHRNGEVPLGELSIDDFAMTSASKNYHLDHLQLRSSLSGGRNRLSLSADFAQAELEGPLAPDDLKTCGQALLGKCLPGLTDVPAGEVEGKEWKLRAQLYKTDFLNDVLDVPLHIDGTAEAEGNLRADDGRMALVVHAPGIGYNKTKLDDVRFYLRGEGRALSCLAQAKKEAAGGTMQFVFEASTVDSLLQTALSWRDLTRERYSGELKMQTACINSHQKETFLRTDIVPTQIAVGDSVWDVASGRFDWGGRRLAIDSFRLAHEGQALTLSGRLTGEGSDSIVARLQRMDIDYLLSFVNIDPVHFSGLATGEAVLSQSVARPRVRARLAVDNFRFNGGLMGDADISGGWDMEEGRIHLNAAMTEQGVGRTLVEGYVSPKDKNLDLSITSFNTNLHFLRRYVGGIFEDLAGRTTGTCRLYGPFKQLDFVGKETVNMSVTIPATGVDYTVSGGSLDITPGSFAFNGVSVADRQGGSGTLDGALRHTHLKNLRYDIEVSADNMLLYDKAKTMDMPFYATVYGSGNVRMNGRPGAFNADISVRPERGTTFVYTLDTPETFNDVSLLKICDKAAVTTDTVTVTTAAQAAGATTTDINLNFLLDMNEQAAMKIITNEKSGDHLLVHGSGPMRASFYNKGSFNLFGTYTVADGVYKLNLQDIIRKDFALTPGSSITFAGDPYEGDLDIQAVYVVNSASLADLNIGSGFSESSVRVNCILNLDGKVHSPEVSFDLDLPTVNEDEKQMVRSIISTEEDMNMQILYLLGVGRFYTYDYGSLATSSTQSQSSVAMKSFLSNTLSSQLNNLISNAIGSSNWTFGANLSTGSVGWSDMEVEGLLSGKLFNNRLLINGNFGYRDRPAYSTNFVGDFDIRYLLTPNGNISLKAYSETNDRYFTKSALTTQGVGILLKRDFQNLRDLIPIKRQRKKGSKVSPAATGH